MRSSVCALVSVHNFPYVLENDGGRPDAHCGGHLRRVPARVRLKVHPSRRILAHTDIDCRRNDSRAGPRSRLQSRIHACMTNSLALASAGDERSDGDHSRAHDLLGHGLHFGGEPGHSVRKRDGPGLRDYRNCPLASAIMTAVMGVASPITHRPCAWNGHQRVFLLSRFALA